MNKSVYTNEIKTTYFISKRIVCSQNTLNANVVLKDKPPQSVLGVKEICTINQGGYILLDFGAEICGGVEITFQESVGAAKIRTVFGESVSEALSEIGIKNATNDHSPRDTTFEAPNFSNMRIGHTGFRFVKIEAVEGKVSIAGVRAASELRDIEYKGSFMSDDELLNRIWNTGARTVHLNMQNFLWDGIKRDRLVWIGDMHAEVSAIKSVFGYNEIVENSLELIKIATPENEWMNGIPSYSFWWLIICNEWYMCTGNAKYITDSSKYICATITHILKTISDDGTDSFNSSMESIDADNPYMKYFIDWETLGSEDSKTGFYAVAVMALNASVHLCTVMGDLELAEKCRKKVQQIKCFKFPEIYNKQSAALGVIAGMCDAALTNKTILSRKPVTDVTSYLGYYVLLAKGMAGDVAGTLNIVRLYWGRMLELGATSFWESFDYSEAQGACPITEVVPPGGKDIHGDFGAYCYKGFRKSLCHGWACGPIPFISRYVLGIQIEKPGCQAVRITPDLGDLKWVEGSFPTPYGNIKIFVENKNGKVLKDIKVPKEIKIV